MIERRASQKLAFLLGARMSTSAEFAGRQTKFGAEFIRASRSMRMWTSALPAKRRASQKLAFQSL
jgi:hypothetical protein